MKIKKEVLPDPTVSNLRYTYESDTNNLYEEIVSIINNASEDLYISTYSIVGLDSLMELKQSIKDASGRGEFKLIFSAGG